MSNSTNNRVLKPRVDIIEHKDQLAVYADMPGVSADNIDITLEKNLLTLHGKFEARNTIYQRAFTLSKRIDRDTITANMKDGVLALTLNKIEEVIPETRQIAVNVA